jgi:hypothetical protein
MLMWQSVIASQLFGGSYRGETGVFVGEIRYTVQVPICEVHKIQ